MPRAKLKELEIEYDVHGSPDVEPLLMVHGLGVQLTNWSESFIDALVSRGFFVIVYDNRDVGLSSKFDSWGPADIPEAFRQARAKETVTAPYTLEDMADDGIALLGSMGIQKAHVLGLSNGGAIAQLMAIRHPDHVASMVSMSATSGRRGLPRPTEAAQAWLNKPNNPLGTREGAMDEAVETSELIGSPGARKMRKQSEPERHRILTAASIRTAAAGTCSPALPPGIPASRSCPASVARRSSSTAALIRWFPSPRERTYTIRSRTPRCSSSKTWRTMCPTGQYRRLWMRFAPTRTGPRSGLL